jgi:hypothetical protein
VYVRAKSAYHSRPCCSTAGPIGCACLKSRAPGASGSPPRAAARRPSGFESSDSRGPSLAITPQPPLPDPATQARNMARTMHRAAQSGRRKHAAPWVGSRYWVSTIRRDLLGRAGEAEDTGWCHDRTAPFCLSGNTTRREGSPLPRRACAPSEDVASRYRARRADDTPLALTPPAQAGYSTTPARPLSSAGVPC